ncbi:type II and III secretion system protein family protein [Desulfopila inferna]|uniref:type II and III secretion system protein family protein n=1 Tax=Desulfopila inferna TaxID=468528 RepID=UPI0019664C97|nr:type II and III secretion system protein family protein [Desulfopila inferna]MBM9603828.1 type II and III secretion system protein family protein [Desulfopila inferna]
MEKEKRQKQHPAIVFIFCLIGLVAAASPVRSAETSASVINIDTDSGESIHLTIDKLAKIQSSAVIKRAHIVNPEIAELVYSKSQSPKWVFVSGKSVGSTQLTLWGENNGMLGSYEVIVSPDISGLKRSLHEIFPGEKVLVRSSGGFLTLGGTVSDSMKLAKILALAEAFAPEKVINLLQVGGIQQVMLEVRIAEISKSVGNRLGINFAWDGSDAFALSVLDNLTAIPAAGWPGNPLEVSNSINSVLGFLRGDTLIVAIDALQQEGLLHILAKPTLIAQSGQSASFLAGGEFPYPVAQEFDKFTIEWKPFGVGLSFTPTVLGDDTISLAVSPEVSELDFTKTISYAGYVVPSIDTRRMSTVVELKDNQSFAIAGLLKNYVRESVKKFPLLGDIPVLGALFRSTRYQKDETELVVIVTPHLVKPVDGDELPLPTDSFEDPSPFESLMLGMLEKYRRHPGADNAMETGSGPIIEGDFGYIIPE